MGAAILSQDASSQTRRTAKQYRAVKPLATNLVDHVTICVEEGLYSQALSLLTSSLTAGTGTIRPANVPPTRFIALAATMVVHPSMSTRTRSTDKHTAADDAIRYLIHLERLVGVKNASIHNAFHFDRTEDHRANRARLRKSLNSEEDPSEGLRCRFAETDSLWTRAEDFWHLLGWALNCSVVHAHRWQRWKHLLNVMLDALENDLHDAIAKTDVSAEDALDGTLLVQYLGTVGSGRNTKRRVMRAILADGSTKSLAEFGEIWQNEVAAPKTDAHPPRKRQKLDISRGEYGDYDEEDSDYDTDKPQRAVSRKCSALTDSPKTPRSAGTNSLGDLDAIKIRQRVLSILTDLCIAQPAVFLSVEELFDLYTEHLRVLPTRLFQELVMSLGTYLAEDTLSSLYSMLLRPSIDAAAPVYNKNELTQADFETHYAPYAANSSSVSENVKVSLLTEGMLRMLWKTGLLTYPAALRKHVEQGITARARKVTLSGEVTLDGKAKSEHRIHEEDCLASSALRLSTLLNIIQSQQ